MSIFDISVFGIHIVPTWYGLMYVLGFLYCYIFFKKKSTLTPENIDSLLLFIFFGVILGGRIGYVLLYNPEYFFTHPSEIFQIWKGGMSFHGGFIGTIIAVWIFSVMKHISFFSITDLLAVCVPVAIGLGRIGNWINHELPGFSPYNGPFPLVIDGVSHFPSPLLEMFLEGVVLSLVMYTLWKKGYAKNPGTLSACFLIGYGGARLISESFRLPDSHIGYLFGTSWITLGIMYTLPLLLSGFSILFFTKERESKRAI